MSKRVWFMIQTHLIRWTWSLSAGVRNDIGFVTWPHFSQQDVVPLCIISWPTAAETTAFATIPVKPTSVRVAKPASRHSHDDSGWMYLSHSVISRVWEDVAFVPSSFSQTEISCYSPSQQYIRSTTPELLKVKHITGDLPWSMLVRQLYSVVYSFTHAQSPKILKVFYSFSAVQYFGVIFEC